MRRAVSIYFVVSRTETGGGTRGRQKRSRTKSKKERAGDQVETFADKTERGKMDKRLTPQLVRIFPVWLCTWERKPD